MMDHEPLHYVALRIYGFVMILMGLSNILFAASLDWRGLPPPRCMSVAGTITYELLHGSQVQP